MHTVIIYNLKNTKGINKTYLIRKIFGYIDRSNHNRYAYKRPGILTKYIQEKWGRSVIVIKNKDKQKAENILKKYHIPYQTKNIKILP